MTGQTNGFVIDAFHQAAVAGDDPGAMIDEIIAVVGIEMALGDRHADRSRKPLPQRPRRRFNAGKLEISGMPGRTVQLAEIADFLHRRVRM